jgi:hypothetical protein
MGWVTGLERAVKLAGRGFERCRGVLGELRCTGLRAAPGAPEGVGTPARIEGAVRVPLRALPLPPPAFAQTKTRNVMSQLEVPVPTTAQRSQRERGMDGGKKLGGLLVSIVATNTPGPCTAIWPSSARNDGTSTINVSSCVGEVSKPNVMAPPETVMFLTSTQPTMSWYPAKSIQLATLCATCEPGAAFIVTQSCIKNVYMALHPRGVGGDEDAEGGVPGAGGVACDDPT